MKSIFISTIIFVNLLFQSFLVRALPEKEVINKLDNIPTFPLADEKENIVPSKLNHISNSEAFAQEIKLRPISSSSVDELIKIAEKQNCLIAEDFVNISVNSEELIISEDPNQEQIQKEKTTISIACLSSFSSSKTFYSQAVEAETDTNSNEESNTNKSSESLDDLARKAQDPLADIAAIVSDTTVNFGIGDNNDRTGVNFQFQGIYSFDFPESGFDLIARAIGNINVVPLERGGEAFGLGDSLAQFFFKPNIPGNWKFGIGPQFSLRTRTDENTGGPSWGAGPVAVLVGTEGPWTLGAVGAQLWSFDGEFSGLTIQPLIYYNFESIPGFSIGYDPIITANWKASGGNKWTVPLGLTIGQLFDLGSGYALNTYFGAYGVPIRPDDGPQWQARLQLFLILPR